MFEDSGYLEMKRPILGKIPKSQRRPIQSCKKPHIIKSPSLTEVLERVKLCCGLAEYAGVFTRPLGMTML